MAARAKEAFEAEAEVRRISNLAQNKGSAESADLRSREPNSSKDGKSAAKAAEQLGVSTRAVEQASRLIKQGDDSLVEAVDQGTVSLDAAEKVSKLPHDEQRKLVNDGKVKDAAATMRKAKVPVEKDAEVTATPSVRGQP